jgi:anti-sigma factor RsiW
MKPCDQWREALADFALGSPADSRLAEHLGKCAACSAALARMQSLTREVDAGVRQLVSEEPDPNSAARILAEVGTTAEQARPLPTGRTIAAAFAVAVLLTFSLGELWRLRTQREETERALSAAAEIFTWKSPTRELLRSPYDSLLKSAPRLGETFYPLDTGSLKKDSSARRTKEKQNQ